MYVSLELYIIMIILMVVGILIVIRMEVPKLLKFKREQWEEDRLKQERVKKQVDEHHKTMDIKINKVAKEENDKLQKENKQKTYRDNVRKGRDYELFITDYFRKQGYQIKPFGILNGRKDKGIDVIIKKDKEITLIQCKNWKEGSSYKIKHQHLKEFLGNTTAFLDNNKDKAEGYTIKRLYVTSNDVLDNSARHFLRDNNIVEHRVIPMAV